MKAIAENSWVKLYINHNAGYYDPILVKAGEADCYTMNVWIVTILSVPASKLHMPLGSHTRLMRSITTVSPFRKGGLRGIHKPGRRLNKAKNVINTTNLPHRVMPVLWTLFAKEGA